MDLSSPATSLWLSRRDGAFPAIDSVVLAREVPGAQLAIYPDACHAFHFQDPERVAADILSFLDR